METYDRSIQLLYKTWQYHFEFLNLGYAAYLDFFGFLKGQFPTFPTRRLPRWCRASTSICSGPTMN